MSDSPVVLYVVNDAWFLSSHRFEIVVAAINAGYAVHIVARRDDTVAQFEQIGCTFHDWTLSPRGTGFMSELIAFLSLWRVIRQIRPDTLHLITIKSLIYGGLLGRLLRIQSVVFAVAGLGNFFVANSLHERLVRSAASAAYKMVLRHDNAHVIVQNDSDRDLFIENNWIDPSRLTLIPGSGVDLVRFRATPERAGSLKVLLASRLLWRKGIREFVEAARHVRKSHPDVSFVLAGAIDAENPQSVRDADVVEWSMEGLIDWRGKCDDMTALLAECHIVCLPTYYGEGLPKVLIEACASARAVVCTDWPGCRDIVKHEVSGLLVPPRDVAALSDALLALINDSERRHVMAKQGRSIAEAGFSVESVVAETLSIYAALRASSSRSVA